MKLSHVIVAVIAMCTVSCGRRADMSWRDGNFEVYALDMDAKATKLGYNHHPGTLGLVEEEVIAAGSSAEFVFVERVEQSSRRTEFYIIPKEGMPKNHSGTVEGPLSEAQFRELRSVRQLPEFKWRKTK